MFVGEGCVSAISDVTDFSIENVMSGLSPLL